MADEDEDVILKQSPLDEYLQQVTNLSFSKYHTDVNHVNLHKKSANNHADGVESFLAVLKLKDGLLKHQLHNKELLLSCCVLLNVTSLTDEDENLLIGLKDEVEKNLQYYEHDDPKRNLYFNRNYLLLGFCIATFAVLFTYLSKSERYEDIFAVAMICVIVSVGIWYYIVNIKKLPREVHDNIQSFGDSINCYNELLDKIVKHLREAEVIRHGYAVLSAPLFSSSKGKNCLKLRHCILDSVVGMFTQVRTNQRLLLQQPVRDFNLDDKEEYIAAMPLDAFSDLLYPTSDGENTYMPLIPLEKIKSMICLLRIQLSEFVYKSIVCLFIAYRQSTSIDLKIVKELLYSIESMNSYLSESNVVLETNLSASTKVVYRQQKSIPEMTHDSECTASQFRSSQIHLYSALSRIDEMEQLGDFNSSEMEKLEVLQNLIIQYNLAIENSKSCIEDVLEKVSPRQNEMKSKIIFDEQGKNEKEEAYVMFEKRAEEGDVLFEGESEEVNQTSDGFAKENVEDFEQVLKESRQSKKLMKELKYILAVKESPAGLLSFPLQKPTEEEIRSDSEDEFTCGEESSGKKNIRGDCKQTSKYYDYEPGVDDYGDTDEESFKHDSVKIRLPMQIPSFLSTRNCTEETFGSTDDEAERDI